MKKLTYEFVKSEIEKERYKLLSKEYKNARFKLKVQCSKKHVYKVSYDNFRCGKRCSMCFYQIQANRQKHSYDFIKEQIEKEGYKLLSNKYKNNGIKIKVCCPEDHKYKVTYGKFYMGRRCPICSGNQKLTYEYVKSKIEKEGYKLLSKKYINTASKLKLQCDKRHEYKVTYGNFQQGKRCPICDYEKIISKPEKEILKIIENILPNNKIIANDRTRIE